MTWLVLLPNMATEISCAINLDTSWHSKDTKTMIKGAPWFMAKSTACFDSKNWFVPTCFSKKVLTQLKMELGLINVPPERSLDANMQIELCWNPLAPSQYCERTAVVMPQTEFLGAHGSLWDFGFKTQRHLNEDRIPLDLESLWCCQRCPYCMDLKTSVPSSLGNNIIQRERLLDNLRLNLCRNSIWR